MSYSEQLESYIEQQQKLIDEQLREIDNLKQRNDELSNTQSCGSLVLSWREYDGSAYRYMVALDALENQPELLHYAFEELKHKVQMQRTDKRYKESRYAYYSGLKVPSPFGIPIKTA